MDEKKLASWFRRIGVIGFVFFLAKGLMWLAVAGLAIAGLR